MNSHIPEKLGKYEVQTEINRGSMGIVYLGYDPYMDKEVAIKVALIDTLNDPESGEQYRKMFFNEAYAAGMLEHPNIIRFFDAGVDGEHCYIVMEYIEEGDTLKSYCMPDTLLPIHKVVEIVFKCAKALDYTHKQGVVHRDIKPSNILVTPDKDIKIGDFSIAHIYNADATTTQVGGMMGSPRYMSPEQLRDEQITNQTDIYSLGVVMYELLTGKQPFSASNFSGLVNKILHKKASSMTRFRADIPDSLSKIVFRALEKDVAYRYQMGLDLAADLSKAFEHLDSSEEDISDQERFNMIKKLEFFNEFLDIEIWEILNGSSFLDYQHGETIIVEGDVDDCFYIIIQGNVEVLKNHVVISTLNAGDCFGEMGYLAKTKRTASIRAHDDTSLLKINSTIISQISLNCQVRFLKVFLRTLIHRLSDTTNQVSRQ